MSETATASDIEDFEKACREEMVFLSALIKSRVAAGVSIVPIMRTLASALGQLAVQFPPTEGGEAMSIGMAIHEVKRSAAKFHDMTLAERQALERSLYNG